MSSTAAVVLVTTSFPVAADGREAAGSFVGDLARELANTCAVRVVAPGIENTMEDWHGIPTFRFVAPDKPLSTLRPWSATDLLEIGRVLRAGQAATRAAVAYGPTAHVLALWALPSGEWARRVSAQTGVPYSVWTLGSDIWTLGRLPIVRNVLRHVLRNARNCYSDGLQLADDTRRISGRSVAFLPSTRRIELKPVPGSAAPPYRMVFLGRWHPNKGIDLLLEALELLQDEAWKAISTIEIYGGGPLEGLVRSRVEILRQRGRPVSAGGYLGKSDAEAALIAADWILLPSRVESIPVVYSDAMKLGKPLVSTPVGDLPRLLERYPAGVCATKATAPAFADAMRQALVRSSAELAVAAAEAADAFSLDRAVAPELRRLATGGNG